MHQVTRKFTFAHDGVRVVTYDVGERELPEDAAGLAEANNWAIRIVEAKAKKAPRNKARAPRKIKEDLEGVEE